LVYGEYDIQLSRPANPFPTLNSTFAANIGPDVVLVRSGPLTVPTGAFTGGAGPNPFFDIEFTTPYTYNGGDLLVTLGHTTATSGTGFAIDANLVADGQANTDLTNSFTDTLGQTNLNNYPITEFSFSPATAAVPEPASLTLLGLGAVGMMGYAWRRQRQQAA
jgi:hypothetical protein